MKLSVVVAAYNERENVGPLTERLRRTLDALGADWELVYVVEGNDGTREILDAAAASLPQLKVLYRPEPSGLGAAFRRGFAAVRGDADFVVTLDADLNHQPEEIPDLLAAQARTGADVVVGSRFVHGASVTGIPLWKRALSGSMNAAMRVLWGLKTRDKTSGFRVYRGAALRGLSFRNDNFAFLPELLIAASLQGLTIVEAPIRFTVRVHGVSKMHILTTSRSYLALLKSRWDVWSLFALLALAAGALLRVVQTFPIHRFPADADALLSGIRAFLILDGHTPVFYSGVRLGALESYAHAAAFALLGPSRTAISLAPLASSCLSLLAFFLLARRLAGRRAACFAAVAFGFPAAAALFWTYMPNGYPEIVLLGLATLLAAVESRERPESRLLPALFGLAGGLGFWCSVQTLACLVPGGLVVLGTPRPARGRARAAALAFLGFLVGAAPWIAYNVRHPFGSFHGNFAAQPASTGAEILGNLGRFAQQTAELVVTRDFDNGAAPDAPWKGPAGLAVAAAAAGALLAALAPWPEPLRRGRTVARGIAPLWGAAALAAVFFALSEAGRTPGPTARYLLFVVPLLATVTGLLLARISLRSVPLALVLAALLAAFQASTYQLFPGRARRAHLERGARADAAFAAFLEARGIRTVLGDYWTAYPVNFLTRERVIGVPVQADHDFYDYGRRLDGRDGPWVLASWWPDQLADLVRRARVAGRTREAAPGTWIFEPADPPPAIEALARLRGAK